MQLQIKPHLALLDHPMSNSVHRMGLSCCLPFSRTDDKKSAEGPSLNKGKKPSTQNVLRLLGKGSGFRSSGERSGQREM